MRGTLFTTAAAALLASTSAVMAAAECAEMGRLAYYVMKVRQSEAPISSVMSRIVEDSQPPMVQQIITQVVVMAYEQPAMRTEANREIQASKFRNDVEVICFSSLGKTD